MGDDGFLEHSASEIRRHNPVGDTLFIDAKVADKTGDEGSHHVHIEQIARNQDGQLSVQGKAVVRLPSRA